MPLLLLPLLFMLGSCQTEHDHANMEKLGELNARWNRLHPAIFHPLSEEDKKILEAFEKDRSEPSIPDMNRANTDELIEGDIIPSDEDIAEMEDILRAEENGETRNKRAASDKLARNWPIDEPIPYQITGIFSEKQEAMIRVELQTFKDNTCIEFVERKGPERKLEFVNSNDCASYVGKRITEEGSHTIWLAQDCFDIAAVQHETMHALGFDHTMNRPDRDEYMDYISDKIPLSMISNFYPLRSHRFDNHSMPYEYNSVMHYEAHAGSSDGSAVMIPKDRSYLQAVGPFHGPTFNDWKALNIRYGCIRKLCNSSIICHNKGYQHPRQCDRCFCPPFVSGTQCENYVHPVELQLEEGATKSFVFNKPSVPNSQKDVMFSEFDKEKHVIKAPEGRKIRVTVNELTPTIEHSCVLMCRRHGVEIVDGDLTVVGKRFCCREISHNQTHRSFVSKTNVVGYQAFTTPGIGFYSNVTFSIEPINEPSHPSATDGPSTDPDSIDNSTDGAGTEESAEEPVTEEPETGEIQRVEPDGEPEQSESEETGTRQEKQRKLIAQRSPVSSMPNPQHISPIPEMRSIRILDTDYS